MPSNNKEAILLSLKSAYKHIVNNDLTQTQYCIGNALQLLQDNEVDPVEMFNCELCGTRLPKGLWVKHPHSEGNELTPPKPSSKVEKLKKLKRRIETAARVTPMSVDSLLNDPQSFVTKARISETKDGLHSLLISKLPEANPREWADNKTQVAWTIGYEKAIKDVKAVLDELFRSGDE